ncbi:hypothetical protein TNCV_5057931 [Trichonephila clavipes]|nr:hypothetical protein TNCV_5057931 [Trichonephila clavipes]
MPPDRQCQIEAHESNHGKGLDCMPVFSYSFEHHAGYSTICVSSTPVLRENTLGVVRGLLSTSRENLRLLRVSILCYKGTLYLQIFMPSPGFKPQALRHSSQYR